MKYSWSLTFVLAFQQDSPLVNNRWKRDSFSKRLFLHNRSLHQQTECIAVVFKHLGRSFICWRIFDIYFWLCHFWHIWGQFLCGKVLNLHLFRVISTFVSVADPTPPLDPHWIWSLIVYRVDVFSICLCMGYLIIDTRHVTEGETVYRVCI